MAAEIRGLETVMKNLDLVQAIVYREMLKAAEMISVLLANYAKTHHGHTPRAERVIYRGYKIKGRGKRKGTLVASKYTRAAGTGWGDITGATTKSIRAGIYQATLKAITVGLTAGMAYDVFLETLHDGKWAWLLPAVEDNRTLITQILSGAIGGKTDVVANAFGAAAGSWRPQE